MLSDPIADMLTRIRNGYRNFKETVDVPSSKFKESIAKILEREGYIGTIEMLEQNSHKTLRITLKYGPKRQQVIKHIERVSRPGRRAYVRHAELPWVQRGLGIAIVSTSKGLLIDREARKLGLGGEVICKVW